MRTNSNRLLVVGNIYDEKNEFLSAGRVYDRVGYSPNIGSSKFAYDKYTIKKYKNSRNDK